MKSRLKLPFKKKYVCFVGLRNDDNVHCHVITLLLLLAHTPLFNCPAQPVHEDESCTEHGSCVLQTLLEKYNRSAIYLKIF